MTMSPFFARIGRRTVPPGAAIVFIALVFCCTPCLAAGYIYLDTGTQPELAALAQGDTRYYPGDPFAVTVVLSNKARDTAMEVDPLLARGAYDPATALGVTVSPRVDGAPVTLKTLPMLAGDIGPWDEVPVTVQGVVSPDARPGAAIILLDVSYSYVYAIPMTGDDYTTFTPLYRDNVQTLPVRLTVQGEVRPAVISETQENMVPGTQVYVTAEVINSGYATGDEVIFSIVPEDTQTFQVVDDSVYIGKFGPGDRATVRARIATAAQAGAGSYPATLEGRYRDPSGVVRNTTPVPLGITISRGAVIELVTGDITLAPGETTTITITYRNAGDTPAVDAMARIIGNQVITAETDTAALGFLAPGETRTVQYVVVAKTSAISGKQYDVDTDVKYRDKLGALMLSDKMSFGALVQPPSGVEGALKNPVVIVLIAGVIAIIIYAAWKIRKG